LTKLPVLEYWKSMLVSLECKDQHIIQGILDVVDQTSQSVTLRKAFIDGKPKEDDGGVVVVR
jgi:hypothetical protein